MKLKILKIYIKTYLKIRFIQLFKSPTNTLIQFNKNPNDSFWLCDNYSDFNNLMIKNQYSLLLIKESFNQLGQAKRFTQLDLTSAYHQMRIQESNE